MSQAVLAMYIVHFMKQINKQSLRKSKSQVRFRTSRL
jgi:hypothetical protein